MSVLLIPAGLLMALFMPGYALTAALWPGRLVISVDRLVMILGASLALDVLAGLLLNFTAIGLRPLSWWLMLGGLTIVLGVVALVRRRPGLRLVRPVFARMPSLFEAAVFGLAGLVAIVALVVGVMGTIRHDQSVQLTQLWMLPSTRAGQVTSVELGIRNQISATTSYRLELENDGQLVRDWMLTALPPGGQWTAVVSTAGMTGQSLEAVLFLRDSPQTVYRSVEVWLPNGTSSS